MSYTEQTLIEKLNFLIDRNLDNPKFTLESICTDLGISRSHLHRVLSSHRQPSTTLYIRKRRLEKAKELLNNTEMRMSEIADAVGFNNPQNFSKYFAEEFKVSPSELKKRILSDPEKEKISIAVLPFVNRSSDINQEYFSDGITEELINVLSHIPNLKVLGRSSSFSFKDKNQDLREFGKLLNVSYILEGSVQKSANKLRITVQLNKVSDGFQVWSEKYDRELTDVFDIQDEISLSILKEIEVKLLGNHKENALKRYTNNPEAYERYLKGRYFQNKFAGEEEYQKAISFFKSAIEIEPNYAIAYSGIASCYLNLWFYRFLQPHESLTFMELATAKAMEIDDQMPDSYLSQARMELLFKWDFKSAKNSYKKALELGGNSAELHIQYALFCGICEKHELAQKHNLIALSIDPFSLVTSFYSSYIYWIAGNFEEALKQGKKMLDLEPNFWGGHFIIGLNLIKNKRYNDALDSLNIALKFNYSGIVLSALGVLNALSDKNEQAQSILVDLKTLKKTKPVSNYDLAIIYAATKDFDSAYLFFLEAIDKNEPSMLFFKFIIRDWVPDFILDDRYDNLVKKIY
jgi:adenylate cyclase